MVSKNQIKIITSLHQKKHRLIHQLFIAEGVKVIQELLESNFTLEHLYVTKDSFIEINSERKTVVIDQDLKKMSALSTASSCLAVFKIPNIVKIKTSGLIVALENISDPGNLGAIIRLCDWFGVGQIVCSKETVDLYNPKVVQATMGSISRVNINYVDLNKFISESKLSIFGTFMNGKNVYQEMLPKEGILLLGSEANGISKDLEQKITHRIAIPRFGAIQKTESLNVATAAAIFLSEFKRGGERDQ